MKRFYIEQGKLKIFLIQQITNSSKGIIIPKQITEISVIDLADAFGKPFNFDDKIEYKLIGKRDGDRLSMNFLWNDETIIENQMI